MPNRPTSTPRAKAGRLHPVLAVAGTIIIAIILAGIVVATRVLWISTRPLPKAPTVIMPKPNAYDYYVTGGKMVKDEKKVSWALYVPRAGQPIPGLRAYTLDDKRKLLSENAPTLAKMREGFRYECRHPADTTSLQLHPENSSFSSLASLLVLESQVRQADGDIPGAASSCLDAIRLGYDIQRGSAAAFSVSGSIQSKGQYRLIGLIPQLSADQGRVAALRLEELRTLQEPYSEMLTEEKWETLVGFEDLRAKQMWPPLVEFLARRSRDNYSAYMDQWIATVKQPYASKPRRPTEPKYGPFEVFFGYTSNRSWFYDLYKRTTMNMLNVELALRAYQAEHGRYPAALSELKPEYLTQIPDDPFAAKGPLGYKLNGTKYVLYSVGPDGKDDGGSPVDEVTRKMKGFKASEHSRGWTPKVLASSDRRFDVDSDSKGDIVAGVNVLQESSK